MTKSKRMLTLILTLIVVSSSIVCIPTTASAAAKGGVYGYLVSAVNPKDTNKQWRKRCTSTVRSDGNKWTTLKVALNTKVYAMDGGVVTGTGYTSASGRYIIIRSSVYEMDYYIKYYHLNSVGAKKGDKIARGQYIAKSGKTGGSSYPNLSLQMTYENWNKSNKMIVSNFVGYSVSSGAKNSYLGTQGTTKNAIKVRNVKVTRDKNKNTITIKWQENPNCSRYYVECATNKDMHKGHIGRVVGTGTGRDSGASYDNSMMCSFTFTGVSSSTQYVRVWGEITKKVSSTAGSGVAVIAISYGDIVTIS